MDLSRAARAEEDVKGSSQYAPVKKQDLNPEPDVELALLVRLCERIYLFFVDTGLVDVRDQKDGNHHEKSHFAVQLFEMEQRAVPHDRHSKVVYY